MLTLKRLLITLVIVLVLADVGLFAVLMNRQPIDPDKALVKQVTAMCEITGVSDDTCVWFFSSRTDAQYANLKTCAVQYPDDVREWITCGQNNGSIPK